jgi:hypothetical protein
MVARLLLDSFFFVAALALRDFFITFLPCFVGSIIGTSSGLVTRLASPPPAISSAFACTFCCNSSSCFSFSANGPAALSFSSCPVSTLNLHPVSSFSEIF